MSKRILVIDDDAAIVDVMRLILEDAGYAVEIQMNGRAARQIAEPLPNLLFLDIRVSGTNGGELCRYLKRQPATRHIPIVLLSAHQETERIAREAGADEFLAKPFEMDDVLALATKYLGSA